MRWFVNHRPKATIERHSLSQPFGLPAPSEREPGSCGSWYHPTGYSLNRKGTGDFHRPYETQKLSPLKNFRFLTQKRYRVGQGTHRIGTGSKRN